MQSITNCPVCNTSSFTPFIQCKDNTVSRETFSIVQCNSCGFKFTNPRPDEDKLGEYYKSEDYVSHLNTKKGFLKAKQQTTTPKFSPREKFVAARFQHSTA